MRILHKPVLVHEILSVLPLNKFRLIVDATVGLGGHTLHFLKNSHVQVIGVDKDAESLRIAEMNLIDYLDRTTLVEGNYKNIKETMKELMLDGADFIFADLGLSSYQLDNERRGFSFYKEGPLDMRFNTTSTLTAAELVNRMSKKELACIFKQYGEEPRAEKIASAIVQARKQGRITTTCQLEEIVRKAKRFESRKHNPVTLVFQALRIAVNDELNDLSAFMIDAFDVLNVNGYMAIISYHSLEDRIVKDAFKKFASKCRCQRLKCQCEGEELAHLVNKKPIVPMSQEISMNPRARSAKLRILHKVLPLRYYANMVSRNTGIRREAS